MSEQVMADRRMYLTEDRTRAVPEGDPEARFLLCTPGTYLSRADAVRYGLLKEEAPPAEESGNDAEPAADAEEKRSTPPAGNKARRRPADKSASAEGDK